MDFEFLMHPQSLRWHFQTRFGRYVKYFQHRVLMSAGNPWKHLHNKSLRLISLLFRQRNVRESLQAFAFYTKYTPRIYLQTGDTQVKHLWCFPLISHPSVACSHRDNLVDYSTIVHDLMWWWMFNNNWIQRGRRRIKLAK